MNSLNNKYSRYVWGGTTEYSDGKLEYWERINIKKFDDDTFFTIPQQCDGRLDIISSLFYNEPRYGQFLAMYNNILDPINEVTTGKVLRIPTVVNRDSIIMTKNKGVKSKRVAVNTIKPILS